MRVSVCPFSGKVALIMEPYAVIETGGKQYWVQAQQRLEVETLLAKPGEKVEISPVLALWDGTSLKIGTPVVPEAKVTATVLDHIRAKKVVSFKKKRRKGYKRKVGHRQPMTVLQIESVV